VLADLSVEPEPRAELSWEAPAECPTQDQVRSYAERLLGKPIAGPAGKAIEAQGQVRRNDTGHWELSLRIVVGDHVEQETLVARQCRALGDAMALKVALACDPFAVVDAVQSDEAAPTEPAAAPAPPPSAPASTRAPAGRDRSSAPRLGLRPSGGIGFEQLPGVSPGVALFGSVAWRTVRVELGAQYYFGRDAHYPDLPSIGAHLQLVSGVVRGCLVPTLGAVGLPLCGGFELGLMRGQGFGVEEAFAAESAWAAVVAGPAVRVAVAPWAALWLEGDAVISLVRPGFRMRNLGTLYTAPGSGARALLGLEVQFAR
jgi:hypothetical protein